MSEVKIIKPMKQVSLSTNFRDLIIDGQETKGLFVEVRFSDGYATVKFPIFKEVTEDNFREIIKNENKDADELINELEYFLTILSKKNINKFRQEQIQNLFESFEEDVFE